MGKSKFDIINDFYGAIDGGPGGFHGETKLLRALTAAGYGSIISSGDVRQFLRKRADYDRYRRRRITFPRHASQRFTLAGGPDLFWFMDTMYLSGGMKWRGLPYRFVVVAQDGFSKKLYGVPLVKITSANVANALRRMVTEENGGVYPKTVITDRGREYQDRFVKLLKDKGVKHVTTNVQQKNKSFLAERAIRSLRLLMQRYRAAAAADDARGVPYFKAALTAVLKSYNSTPHTVIGLAPIEAALPENFARVYSNLETERYRQKSLHAPVAVKLNSKLHLGDIVRKRIVAAPFEKEVEQKYSQEKYRISDIKLTEPLFSYKLADLTTDLILPGTYTYFQLLPV